MPGGIQWRIFPGPRRALPKPTVARHLGIRLWLTQLLEKWQANSGMKRHAQVALVKQVSTFPRSVLTQSPQGPCRKATERGARPRGARSPWTISPIPRYGTSPAGARQTKATDRNPCCRILRTDMGPSAKRLFSHGSIQHENPPLYRAQGNACRRDVHVVESAQPPQECGRKGTNIDCHRIASIGHAA